MERLRKMKKPVVSFGIVTAIAKGKHNPKLFIEGVLDAKAKIGDYNCSVTDDLVIFETFTKTGLKHYIVPRDKFETMYDLKIE